MVPVWVACLWLRLPSLSVDHLWLALCRSLPRIWPAGRRDIRVGGGRLVTDMTPATVLLTVEEIKTARAAIDPVFLNSPLMRHPALDDALGCALVLKVETLNPIRSFKGRGTEAVLASLSPRPAAVITASSGNFG